MDNKTGYFIDCLPERIKNIVKHFQARSQLLEIRMRVDRPIMVRTKTEEVCLTQEGRPCGSDEAYPVTRSDIEETVNHACNYSLYAFDEQLRNGYITIKGGNRIGLCGEIVMDRGQVQSIRNISAINIRFAKEVPDCSETVMPYLYEQDTVYHTLIVSPPCCGKTTLLRDIIRNLSDGWNGHKGLTVGVVDERGEIAACYYGIPQNNIGIRTDVLDGCPKSVGMLMLVRSMAPQVIAVDEIGGRQDAQSVFDAVYCGCRMLATVHATDYAELTGKPGISDLIKMRIFKRIIFLSAGNGPGTVEGIFDEKGTAL